MRTEATARNIRVQNRYDELMGIGRHGHYETMFQVVREETESLRQQLAEAQIKIDLAAVVAEKVIQLDYAGSVWMLDLPKIMQNLIEKLKEK